MKLTRSGTSPLRTWFSKCRAILLAFPVLFLSGCFQIEDVLHLKPDGSGTVEQTVTMSTAMINQLKQMQAGNGQPDAAAKPFELLDESKLKDQAKKMGDGVTFVSAKKISTPTSEGFTAIFAFTDVSKLKLSPEPPNMGPGVTTKTDDSKAMTFQFKKGKIAELRISNPSAPKADDPQKPKEAEAPAKEDPSAEAMTAMMMQALKDMRIAVRVQAEGTITDTNGKYRDGSKVTLMDVDFNKILADPAKAKQLMKASDENSPENVKLLQSVPGVQFEAANPVIIHFQ